MRCTGRGFAVAGLAVAALLGSAVPVSAQQSDPAITGFPVGSPSQITLIGSLRSGPDGALWFTWLQDEPTGAKPGLGRITTSGVVTQWPAPTSWSGPGLGSLIAGAGSIWTADNHDNKHFIGQWNVNGTLVKEYALTAWAYGLTWGPDNALWFSGAGSIQPTGVTNSYIGRLAMDGTVTTYPMPDPSNLASDITLGSDGAFWFVEEPGANAGRVTTGGVFTEYPIPGDPGNLLTQFGNQTITLASDGAVWLTTGLLPSLTRVSPTGNISNFPVPAGGPNSLTTGPDGNLWFAANNGIGRMTLSGETVNYPLPDALSLRPTVITSGPDGKLWFGVQGFIGRLDPSIPPPASGISPATTPIPDTGAGAATAGQVVGVLAVGAGLLAVVGACLTGLRRRRGNPPAD